MLPLVMALSGRSQGGTSDIYGLIEKVVLERIAGRVVIFVDEIDIVRSLQFSTDEFFAAIREFYNRRARESVFNRLGFGLLGVATPTDLIRDTRMTPFNVGRRIELNDFSPAEAVPLARGLSGDDKLALEKIAIATRDEMKRQLPSKNTLFGPAK